MRWLSLLLFALVSGPAWASSDPHAAPPAHGAPAPAAEHGAAAHGEAAHGEAAHADAGHAEGGHGEEHTDHTAPPMKAIGLHALNFVLLYALLFAVARKPVRELLRQRQASIRKDLEDADAARSAAQARFDALEARLVAFEVEVAGMKAQAQEQAEREAELMSERTQRDIAQLKETTERAIREETRHARLALKKEAVDLAVKLAEERIRSEISAADQQRLAGEFLVSIPEGKGHA